MGPLPPARLKSLVGGESMDAEGVWSRSLVVKEMEIAEMVIAGAVVGRGGGSWERRLAKEVVMKAGGRVRLDSY